MKFPLGLPYKLYTGLSGKGLKKLWKKQKDFSKNLKSAKFKAKAKLKEVTKLPRTTRGKGGFGSTGR